MSSQYPSPSDNSILVLPFTEGIYHDATPLLPVIYQTVLKSIHTCSIVFSTPAFRGKQLYPDLRSRAKVEWDRFHTFLSKVYMTMLEAQWRSGTVLMDVEVHFDGEDGDRGGKLGQEDAQLLVLEGEQARPLRSSRG